MNKYANRNLRLTLQINTKKRESKRQPTYEQWRTLQWSFPLLGWLK